MEPIAPHLPAVMGSLAGLVVAFVSLMAQVSPVTCVWRAVAAFSVFSAFGIVIRYLLGDAEGGDGSRSGNGSQTGESDFVSNNDAITEIEPGTSVEQLLAQEEHPSAESSR